jgi:transcriptional regulator with XRE-family HTH domain
MIERTLSEQGGNATRTFLPDRLKKLLGERGWNQKRLAQELKYSPAAISALVNYKPGTNVTERTLTLLSQLFGKKPEYFIDESVTENEADIAFNKATNNSLSEIGVDKIEAELGKCYNFLAAKQYDKALWCANELNDHNLTLNVDQKARLKLYQAKAHNRMGGNGTTTARNILQTLQTEIEKSPKADAVIQAQVNYELGVGYYEDQRYDTAQIYYEQAKAVLEKEKLLMSEDVGLYVLNQLAKINYNNGAKEKAEEYYQLAKNHRKTQEDDRTRARILQAQGLEKIEKAGEREIAEGFKLLEESARLFEKLDLVEQSVSISSFLNAVRAELGKFKDIKDDYDDAEIKEWGLERQVRIRTNRVTVYRLQYQDTSDKELLRRAQEELDTLKVRVEILGKDDELVVLDTELSYYACAKYCEAKAHILALQSEDLEGETKNNLRKKASQYFTKALDYLQLGFERVRGLENITWADFREIYAAYISYLRQWGERDNLLEVYDRRDRDEEKTRWSNK